MAPSINLLFATAIYSEFFDIDLDALESACLSTMKQMNSRVRSNRGGWQSSDVQDDMFFITSSLAECIKKSVDKFTDTLGLHDVNLDNMWININGKNHYNAPHTHPAAVISGVFYVRVPEDSGNIVFMHPALNLLERDWSKRQNRDTGHNSETFMMQPKENLLLLFPSWVNHSVESNQNDENRISISFNFS